MKKYNLNNILTSLGKSFMALALAIGLNACDNIIYDFEEDCDESQDQPLPDVDPTPEVKEKGYYVKFIFDRNMQFVDGFSKYVQTVDLYAFNASGDFVKKYHADVSDMIDNTMELTDLPAGEYELIAWCGLGDCFTVPDVSRREQLICTMTTWTDDAYDGYQNTNLNDPRSLYHGRRAADCDGLAVFNEKTPRADAEKIYLTKNTNSITLTLQHRDGLEFDKSRFTVTMHDRNKTLRYDNSISAESATVEYRPYSTKIGTTTSLTRAESGSTTGNFLLIELECSRLMEGTDPRISVIDNETGKEIFSIPMVNWALKLRNSKYQDMDEQEYLDREDNYNLMLWMDNKQDGWFGVNVEILDWHVVEDEEDIK